MSGSGHAISLASVGVDWGGLSWFFSAGSPEMLIKVLDSCAVNGKFWVFCTASTNVGLAITVTDLQNGNPATNAHSDLTTAPPLLDVNAFPCP